MGSTGERDLSRFSGTYVAKGHASYGNRHEEVVVTINPAVLNDELLRLDAEGRSAGRTPRSIKAFIDWWNWTLCPQVCCSCGLKPRYEILRKL